MTSEGFPRSRRLTRASDINAVVRAGRRVRTSQLDIFWRPNQLGYPRLGLVVPRYGSTAVARNRLRRRLWEIARRRILPGLAPLDLVVRPRVDAYRSDSQHLSADLAEWLRSL